MGEMRQNIVGEPLKRGFRVSPVEAQVQRDVIHANALQGAQMIGQGAHAGPNPQVDWLGRFIGIVSQINVKGLQYRLGARDP